jgi:hypothetical protein
MSGIDLFGVGMACAFVAVAFAAAGAFTHEEKTVPRRVAYALWAVSALFAVPLLLRLWLALVLG